LIRGRAELDPEAVRPAKIWSPAVLLSPPER
jgi:hypothetical protein